MKTCESCLVEIDGSYGSGRFCGPKCARGFSTRDKRKEINEKVSKVLNGKIKVNGKLLPKHEEATIICEYCRKFVVKPYSRRDSKCCSLSCARKLAWSQKDYRENIIDKVKERVSSGNHIGWTSRNVLSYPEQFFKKVLDENGYEGRYRINFPVKKSSLGLDCSTNYFLDFYFEDLRLDLEIDGKQHKYPERVKSDHIRDIVLKENGYKVHRIEWRSINKPEGQEYIKEKIQELLKLLSECRDVAQ